MHIDPFSQNTISCVKMFHLTENTTMFLQIYYSYDIYMKNNLRNNLLYHIL